MVVNLKTDKHLKINPYSQKVAEVKTGCLTTRSTTNTFLFKNTGKSTLFKAMVKDGASIVLDKLRTNNITKNK